PRRSSDLDVGLNGGQELQSSWNADVTGSTGSLTATPNGNGNTFGITLFKNGNDSLPSASCSSGGGGNPNDGDDGGGNDGGNDGGGDGTCSASVTVPNSWND